MTSGADTPRQRAWFTLFLLLALYLCAMVDRNVISVLVAPIREEFGIGESDVGLLLGPAFGLSYVLLAFPFAWWADRWSRRGVVFVGIVIWSIANCSAGLTQSFEALFAARVAVGAGEAALVPAAYVLISQLFPRKSLALALSIFSMGSVGGMAVSYGLGGWLLDAFEGGRSVPFIGHLDAWRLVFFITGIPSLLLGLMLWFVPERAPDASARQQGNGVPLLPFLRAHPWPAIGIPVAFGMASLCSAALVSWLPSYMMPAFDLSATKVGAILALMIAAVSSIGKLGSGLAVDRMFARGTKDAHPRFLLIALSLATPLTVLAFFTDSVTVFIVLLAIWFLLAYPLQGYGAAAIQVITPTALRGRTSAIFIVIVNLLATTVGPAMAGYLSEHVFAGNGSLGLGLAATLAVWAPLTVLLLWFILIPTRRAVEANESSAATVGISGSQTTLEQARHIHHGTPPKTSCAADKSCEQQSQ